MSGVTGVAGLATVVEVVLGERSYPIHIGPGVRAGIGTLFRAQGVRRAVVVTNPLVGAHWLGPLRSAIDADLRLDVIEVPDGEAHKDWNTLHGVLTRMLELAVERSTPLIALGGGVVGDLAGFAGAIYQRGIPVLQVPTTLLAQVDSSVGGKTAVNHPLGKNMIGAFAQPAAVFADTDVLATLPRREYLSGLAEVVKYGAIADAAFFAWLEQNVDALLQRQPRALSDAIARSCAIKAGIVARDERESGERALLNFGHTFGHAIETGVGYGEWLHGEAVAAGMIMAARLSVRRGDLPASDAERLTRLLERAGLPVVAPELGIERYRALMRRDKKVQGGAIRFILLRAIGEAYMADDVRDGDLDTVLA